MKTPQIAFAHWGKRSKIIYMKFIRIGLNAKLEKIYYRKVEYGFKPSSLSTITHKNHSMTPDIWVGINLL